MELGNAIVVLFIAGAGYTYCAHCVLIKYQLHRDSGQKLYLASLASGLAFFLLTYALYLLQEFI